MSEFCTRGKSWLALDEEEGSLKAVSFRPLLQSAMETLLAAASMEGRLAVLSEGRAYSYGALLRLSRQLALELGIQSAPPLPPSAPSRSTSPQTLKSVGSERSLAAACGYGRGPSSAWLQPWRDALGCLHAERHLHLCLAQRRAGFSLLPGSVDPLELYGRIEAAGIASNNFVRADVALRGNQPHFRRGQSTFPALDGPRVGIYAEPTVQFVSALWATWRAGGVAVPLATSHPDAELTHVLRDADVSIVVAPEAQRNRLKNLSESCNARFVGLPPLTCTASKLLQKHDKPSVASLMVNCPPPDGQSAAMIVYTSGTTGRPKGAVHTHCSLAAQAEMIGEAWEYSPNDCMLNCLPLHHVHGAMNALIAPLSSGGSVEFMPKFSPSKVWARWRESYPEDESPQKNAITMFTGVPTMYVRLLQTYDAMGEREKEASSRAARKLRLMMCGSAALPEVVMERWEAVTGHRLLERYGMTELGMALTNPLRGERRPGHVGGPFPGVKVQVIPEDGREEGELRVRTSGMFREYWRRPEATKEAFDEEGFFLTGDAVKVEDGYFRVLGRRSVDILKSGGFKVSALEIEAALLQHPLIAECTVVGVADEEYGERIAAVVALKEEGGGEASQQKLDLEGLQTWALERMAPYKVPSVLKVVASIPRNAMGKVNKKEVLRDLFGQGM